jgi:hypothetical protein
MKKLIAGLILMAALSAFAQIPPLTAITNVYTGTGPNTGTGDPAITAFNKINTNTMILSNSVAQATSNTTASAISGESLAENSAECGMIPNGYHLNDISITNITMSCPNGDFNNSMIGMGILVNHAGPNGSWLYTSISNVYSATMVGVSNAATMAVTNMSYCILYNKATALSNCITAQNALNAFSNYWGGRSKHLPASMVFQVRIHQHC